jgi:hypothetical protein
MQSIIKRQQAKLQHRWWKMTLMGDGLLWNLNSYWLAIPLAYCTLTNKPLKLAVTKVFVTCHESLL